MYQMLQWSNNSFQSCISTDVVELFVSMHMSIIIYMKTSYAKTGTK